MYRISRREGEGEGEGEGERGEREAEGGRGRETEGDGGRRRVETNGRLLIRVCIVGCSVLGGQCSTTSSTPASF